MWKTLREALRGTTIDYTTAPVGRAVILLAVPMVLEMAMESIFAVADVFWVAHLGADAVATVGLTESLMTMIYTAALGLIAAPFAPSLLRGMGATEDVVRTGSGFARLMLGGNATVLLLFLQNAVFRGAGDAAVAMR